MRVDTRTGVCVHFLNRNMHDTVIILEEVKLPHPQYPCCDMLLLWVVLNDRQPNTTQCTKGVGCKWHRMAVEEMKESTGQDFRAYGRPFNSVPSFKYLDLILMALDNDCPMAVRNLKKAHKK